MSIIDMINTLEQRLNLKLSKEQKAILEYNLKSPILVDACAGSGKTMLLILMMLVLVETHQYPAHQILGITFSKRAQLDMKSRYDKVLLQYNALASNQPRPYFSTFHALFYHLLRSTKLVRGNQVLTSYLMISNYLEHHLPHPSEIISKDDLLKQLFQVHDQMINLGMTFDGLTLLPNVDKEVIREGKKYPKLFLKFAQPENTHDEQMVENYRSVIKAYNHYKHVHHVIDFSDMMIVLYKAVKTMPQVQRKVKYLMSNFKIIFMDEFQDISQLQWKLMQAIMSDDARHHLVTIGDDDQSIYSFRGSDPRIILQLHSNYPTTKVFHLSTNYRTGGKILKSAIPLITSNHYRLTKQLLSGRKNQGKLIEFLSNDRRFTANQMLLKHLLKDLNNPTTDDSQIAVLVRYNNSRMFITDWLASHHYYMSIGNRSYILQNNYLYKTFIGLAKGLLSNNIYYIYKYARKIAFQPYQNQIRTLVKTNKIGKNGKISDYCQVASKYDEGKSSHLTHADKVLSDAEHGVQHPSKMYKQNMGALIWIGVNNLTKYYFKYMLKNKYLNQDTFNAIRGYLSRRFIPLSSKDEIKRFFRDERHKKLLLSRRRRKNDSVKILSLHQSKGLQFKHVYLYDLNNQQDTTKEIAVNHYFAPNMSMIKFLSTLMSLPNDKINKIDEKIYGDKKEHALSKLVQRIIQIQEQDFLGVSDLIGDIVRLDFHNTTEQAAIEEQTWQIYHDYLHISKAIEEERRLIYVGVTRAQDELFIAYNRDANPLLNELAIPKPNRYYLEPNSKVLNYKDNLAYQDYLKKLHSKFNKN